METIVERGLALWEKWDTPHVRKVIRYTMVSAISTVVSFVALLLIFGVLHLFAEVGSTIAANVIATVPNYYLNRSWVWGKNGRSHLTKEIIPFWVMSAIGVVVSIGGAALARDFGIDHHLSHEVETVVVLAANIASFGIFWVLKFLVFNRLFRVEPVEMLDELVEVS
ncbi:MAG: GtrA family protein [Acidimicrobiales bacterium]